MPRIMTIFAFMACFLVVPTVAFTPHSPEHTGTEQQQQLKAVSAESFIQHGAVFHRQQVLQPSGTTSTTHENFFTRMGHAFMGVLIGIIMIVFSVPVLWLNEKRSAKYEALISVGEEECHDISADDYDEKNTSWLVHVTGDTVSKLPVQDKQFNVRYESGVIRLTSVVEIFQNSEEEKSKTTEKETFGGGKTTTTETWYEYTQGWRPHYNSGAGFKGSGHKNRKPDGLEAGSFSETCERVEFGRGFLLQDAELQQLQGGNNAKLEKKVVCEKNTKLTFAQGQDGKHYCCAGGIASPEIGDVRVSFTVLNDGPSTVVALQAALKEEGRAGFLPYRVIRRPPCPCFPLSEEKEKEMLYDEATRDPDKIVDEEMWHGMMMCCCCACNIVQYCCLRGMMPELHHAFGSKMSKSEAFEAIKARASALKWVFRGLGWLLMFVGLCLTFGPFTTALKLFPFGIGTFLSSMAGFILYTFSFMVTLVISIFIVAMAYLMYRPMLGIITFVALGAIIAGILALTNHYNASHAM